MRTFRLTLILSLAAWIGLSACANRHLDYGHRVNYWNNKYARERKPMRYYYPHYNPENRPRFRSY